MEAVEAIEFLEAFEEVEEALEADKKEKRQKFMKGEFFLEKKIFPSRFLSLSIFLQITKSNETQLTN